MRPAIQFGFNLRLNIAGFSDGSRAASGSEFWSANSSRSVACQRGTLRSQRANMSSKKICSYGNSDYPSLWFLNGPYSGPNSEVDK